MIARQVYLEYISRKRCISRAFHEKQRPGRELFAAAAAECGVSRTGAEAQGVQGPSRTWVVQCLV